MSSETPTNGCGNDSALFKVETKESTIEGNKHLRRFHEREGSILTFESRKQAEIEAIHLSYIGTRDLRIQTVAKNDTTPADAYLIPTGGSRHGYGRTTENATTGWEKKRKEVLNRDDFICQECKRTGGPAGEVQLHVDHVTPKSAGGTDETSNLRTLCKECHLEKHGSTPRSSFQTDDEIARAVVRTANAAQYPIFTIFELKDELEIGSNAIKRLRSVMSELEKWDNWGEIEAEYGSVYFKREANIDRKSIEILGGQVAYQNYLLDSGTAVRRLDDKQSTSLSDFS
ncbi:HNH endonuclease [Halorussus salinus]|uniref:HNH endonuclease n=1 Tax=Halorussus salinus TaxID=1364935 RepID=UPI001092B13A|nr:HNH endonuclease [Halorussus salinus]